MLKHFEKRLSAGLTLLLPVVLVRWFWHGTRDTPHVVLLLDVAVQCAVREVKLIVFLKITAEFGERPMRLIGKGGIIKQRKDFAPHPGSLHLPWTTSLRAVNESVNAKIIVTSYPIAEGSLFDSCKFQHDVIIRSKE